MNKVFAIVVVTVTIFIGYMLGYSIPPFMQSGAFSSERKEKGVEVKVDKDMQDYYKDLYKEEGEK